LAEEKFAYTTVPNTLRNFLKGVPDRAVPLKVTSAYLRTISMKSSNDRTIIPVLKFIGLLDGSGAPKDEYSQFKNKMKGGLVLANLIRTAYADLFSTYDDPHNQSEEALLNFFREKTKLGSNAVRLMTATFKVLCEFADFKGTTPVGEALKAVRAEEAALVTGYPSINITLQIHLPESKDSAIYDSIFQAISRHLLKGK
jgi:hypothetical protein